MTETSALSTWAHDESSRGGWIRRMFQEGQRLKAIHGADAVADLSIGQPLEATDAVRKAFSDAAAEHFPGRYAYMPSSGYPDVRERCAADIGVPANAAFVTSGAAGALSLALRALVQPGADVVALAPYFVEFRLYAEVLGSPFRAVAARPDGRHDLAALEAALTPTTGALIVNSPCNPSGAVFSDDEYATIAEILNNHNRKHNTRVLLLVDEVYHRLTYDGAQRSDPFAHYERCAVARSFSKDLGVAGERIGYLALHPSMASSDTERGIEMCARALGFVNAPATAQRALLKLGTWDIDLTPYVERRALICAALQEAELDFVAPEGGLYVWIRSPWDDPLAWVEALAAQRVLLTPGVAFGVDSHVRLCFSQPLATLRLASDVITSVGAHPV